MKSAPLQQALVVIGHLEQDRGLRLAGVPCRRAEPDAVVSMAAAWQADDQPTAGRTVLLQQPAEDGLSVQGGAVEDVDRDDDVVPADGQRGVQIGAVQLVAWIGEPGLSCCDGRGAVIEADEPAGCPLSRPQQRVDQGQLVFLVAPDGEDAPPPAAETGTGGSAPGCAGRLAPRSGGCGCRPPDGDTSRGVRKRRQTGASPGGSACASAGAPAPVQPAAACTAPGPSPQRGRSRSGGPGSVMDAPRL